MEKTKTINQMIDDILYESRKDVELEDIVKEGLTNILKRIYETQKIRDEYAKDNLYR